MDTGRKHEIQGAEMKGRFLLIEIVATRVFIFLHRFPEPQFPDNNAKRARKTHMRWVVLQEKNPEIQEAKAFPLESKYACYQGDMISIFQRFKQTCPLF